MSEPEGTPPKENLEEPGKQPVTPPTDDGGTSPQDDDMVTISRKDLKALQSQRDSANEASRKALEGVEYLHQKDAAKDFLDDPENAQKYPDVKISDLIGVGSDNFAEAAEQIQQDISDRFEARQARHVVDEAPSLTPEEKAAKLEELRKDPAKNGGFMGWLKLQRTK